MEYIFRELQSEHDINQCVDLQRNVFCLSETDVISPLFLKLIARNLPPVGVSLGVFLKNNESELIGFITGIASFIPDTIHATLMGIKKEYQNKGLGYQVYIEFKNICCSKGIKYMTGIFDPIESKLAYLYFSKLGFIGLKYEEEAYKLHGSDINYVPIDKLLIKWDFNAHEYPIKNKFSFDEHIDKFEHINEIKDYNSEIIIYKLPENFKEIQKSDKKKAFHVRMKSRAILTHVINNLHYNIVNCLSDDQNNPNNLYYILKKRNKNAKMINSKYHFLC